MWKFVALALVAIVVVAFGFSLIDAGGNGDVQARAAVANVALDTSGFARAIAPWEWQFPRDHGAHPEFQTEWWYYTGNLGDASGRRFGYQFTIFRRALTPQTGDSESEWRANQVYLVHFTLSDVAGGVFYQDERYSRGAAELAGATFDPRFRVWLEDWQVVALDDAATRTRITAQTDDVALDLTLEQVKPPVLQGDDGLSAKSPEPGNASYYYSLSRLLTEGAVTVKGETFIVSGTTWMDREFSTSALDSQALGWDWFGLQLDDNRELMLGYIRLKDGGKRSYGASLVQPDGAKVALSLDEFSIEPTGTWTSPHTGAVYPAGWEITIAPEGETPFTITLTPLLADQELQSNVSYWEGAVRIMGDVTGYGYAELTGYVDSLAERF